MQPNKPLYLEETGVQASTAAILTKHQEAVLAAAVSSGDDEANATADASSRSGGAASSSGRPAKHPRLSRDQKQVSMRLVGRQGYCMHAAVCHALVSFQHPLFAGASFFCRVHTAGPLKGVVATTADVGLPAVADEAAHRVCAAI